MNLASLSDDLPEEPIYLAEPYTKEFTIKLLDECRANPDLELPKIEPNRIDQII
jgi:hypothetical protein